MTFKTCINWVSRFCAPLIAFVLAVAPSVSLAQAVEDSRKVSVVSFGLFGDQSVFRSEATGAAKIIADRFGNGPVDVQYNSKKGGKATIETLVTSLQTTAKGWTRRTTFCFSSSRHTALVPALPSKQGGSPKC